MSDQDISDPGHVRPGHDQTRTYRSRTDLTRTYPTRTYRSRTCPSSRTCLPRLRSDQLIASKTGEFAPAGVLTNWSSPAFGFGVSFGHDRTARRELAETGCMRVAVVRDHAGRPHEGALDLVGRPARVPRQHVCNRARDDRRRERGAGQLDPVGADEVRGLLRRHRRAFGDRADHVAARSRDLRLVEAVLGVAVGRPRSDVSSSESTVPLMSTAPTVITNGSLPGA